MHTTGNQQNEYPNYLTCDNAKSPAEDCWKRVGAHLKPKNLKIDNSETDEHTTIQTDATKNPITSTPKNLKTYFVKIQLKDKPLASMNSQLYSDTIVTGILANKQCTQRGWRYRLLGCSSRTDPRSDYGSSE